MLKIFIENLTFLRQETLKLLKKILLANGFKMYKVLKHDGKKHKVFTRKKKKKEEI